MLVEKELKTVTSKLKKELVELKEQANYLTQLIVTNRSNLLSVLESQIQTTGGCPSIEALHEDLENKINACTDPRVLLEGFRDKINNDGDKYQRYPYLPPYFFNKIKPIYQSEDEDIEQDEEEACVSETFLPPSCIPETIPSKNNKRRKRDETKDVPEDPVLPKRKCGKKEVELEKIEMPKHNRLTRSSHTIRTKISRQIAKIHTIDLVGGSDDHDLDYDDLGENLSPDDVVDMFQDAQVVQGVQVKQVEQVQQPQQKDTLTKDELLDIIEGNFMRGLKLLQLLVGPENL
jgi:hypothetical protein